MQDLMVDDVRIKNAKVRLEEQRRKRMDGEGTKRGRLQDLEDETMREENPQRLEELFKLYMEEYNKEKDAKRVRLEGEAAPMDIGEGFEELEASVNQVINEELKVYAWDDVNDIELPIETVRKARVRGDRVHEGQDFQGCQEVRIL